MNKGKTLECFASTSYCWTISVSSQWLPIPIHPIARWSIFHLEPPLCTDLPLLKQQQQQQSVGGEYCVLWSNSPGDPLHKHSVDLTGIILVTHAYFCQSSCPMQWLFLFIMILFAIELYLTWSWLQHHTILFTIRPFEVNHPRVMSPVQMSACLTISLCAAGFACQVPCQRLWCDISLCLPFASCPLWQLSFSLAPEIFLKTEWRLSVYHCILLTSVVDLN